MKKNKLILIIITIIVFIAFGILFIKTNKVFNNSGIKDNDYIEKEEDKPKKTIHENELKTKIEEGYNADTSIQSSSYYGIYKKLFNTEEIKKVNINIYDKNYIYLLENAKEKPYVLADSITIDDVTIKNVGIKTKGNKSLRDAKLDKYSFTINTNKYTKQLGINQNLYGLKKFSLNNMNLDTTFLKEYLSYYLMNELGICTPYYSIVELFINNENKGIYLLLENIEYEMINRCYNETGKFLSKPEEIGGDLVYLEELDNYIGENGNYEFDIENYEDKDNILQKYKDILEEKQTGEDITDKDVNKEKLNKELDMFFKWLKKLNMLSNTKEKNTIEFEKEVESIIDIDNLIKYFAALVFLPSDDSYIGMIPHNYGLYINNNMKMNIIPWDFNLSFGNYLLNSSQMINHRIDNPGFKIKLEERPLLNIVLGNKNYREKYYYYLDVCTKIAMGGTILGKTYETNNFVNIINKLDKYLINIIDSKVDYYNIEQHNKGIRTLKNLIRLRTKAVKRQLEGDFTEIKTTLDIADLGNIY